MIERIEVQADKHPGSVDGAPLCDVDVVCYGIGRFSTSLPSRLQLAVLLALHSSLPSAPACSLGLYEPLLSSLETAVVHSLGVGLIERNEEAKRRVSRCTVFYMPHCGQALYNNLLWANWGWRGGNDEPSQQQPRPTANRNSEEKQREDEQPTDVHELSSALSAVLLSSTSQSAHLGHVILIGNQLSAYIDKRSFPTNHSNPPTRNNSRHCAQRPSYQSSRCPIHSVPPATRPSMRSSVCQHESVCLVDACGLLQCRSLDSELRRDSSDDMRLAFHDTAVQWFDWAGVSGEQRERAKRWLLQRLSEPEQLTDDGELVSPATEGEALWST